MVLVRRKVTLFLKLNFVAGDLAGAQRNSQEALRLNKIALGVGVGVNVAYITFMAVYIAVVLGAFY